MSVRHQQIESSLRRVISDVLARQINDPRVRGLVSITGVAMSQDRRTACVSVSVVPEEHEARTLAALQRASEHIHRKVFKALGMKIVPQLDFQIDRSLKREAAILEAIRGGVQTDRDRRAARQAASAVGPHPDGSDPPNSPGPPDPPSPPDPSRPQEQPT